MAIRSLTDHTVFSTALNFHSFGRFLNVPFATHKLPEPSPHGTHVLTELAKAMTKTNHFRYGHAWSEVRACVCAEKGILHTCSHWLGSYKEALVFSRCCAGLVVHRQWRS